ncbi:hypothetical protein JQX13_34015 [Archangium violaceum]|uniref:hypothetical protein n=1 Tax=Archangium violaceum TaxID=83451 RepID=UPI00193B72B2|nr:hypothetical protein [Archangium violaceum]QRK05189.1 hypothetical protein JQX13_34015 [Archangium violaceum]
MRERHERNRTLALMVMLGVLVTGGCAPPGPRETTGETGSQQPAQPPSGPGGSDYPHVDMRVSSGGEGVYGWYVFEPIHPQPASAPLAIILHGYAEYSGYDMMYELIRHTVRKGNVVIYPRWQTGLTFPCAGAFDIEPCMTSARVGIQRGLEFLNGPGRVRPQLKRTSYFGFSFGGILTANLANRHASIGLPTPRAIFLEDPHDGGTDGEGGLDETLDGIPASVKLQCHSSEEGIISEKGKAHSSCNAVFPKLGHIPDENKDLVMIRTDRHGTPPLSSRHGVSAGGPGYGGRADAYDWNFVWKVWDALRSCAYDGTDCRYALGDTPEHRSLGVWSDGQPVIPLVIQDAAPLRP